MEKLGALVCLGLVCLASAIPGVVDPRGARPVEQGTRNEKCATEKSWPFCTDDLWGSKCPSGCRMLGLIDANDLEVQRKIERIRSDLDQNKQKHRSTDLSSKLTYDILKEKLTIDSGHDNNYLDLAQGLRQRITDMKIRIVRQLNTLAALKERVKDQVTEMKRMEIDIDIKLRSCKGSCKSYSEHQVDHESYVVLDKQVNQLDSQTPQTLESVGTLYVMKSRPLQDAVVDNTYKSKDAGSVTAAQRTEDMFTDVKTVQLVLEQEGSPSSPATISKLPGTSSSSSGSSSSSSSSSSDSSRSITELGGFDGLGSSHVSSQTVHCTKTLKRVVTHTKDGPMETTEEVYEGGPGCQAMTDLAKGGISFLFPSLGDTSSSTSTSTSSSSSSTSSHTSSHSGGAKGSLVDSKTDPFGSNFGLDLGGFLTDAADDDVPNVHARGLKSARTERHAGYVGKDCVDAHQKHLNGETNGLFQIRPGGASTPAVEVYCRQEGLMGGWLLAQQRQSGALGFNRTWAEYRAGFGSVDAAGNGEFWLGNQNLHLLTAQGETMLRVELEDWEGGAAAAEYTLRVGAEQDGFPLHASGYTGEAGDALAGSAGRKFSTADRENGDGGRSCAAERGGGWWYGGCQGANLNGLYGERGGVLWDTFRPVSLKAARMLIRPAAF